MMFLRVFCKCLIIFFSVAFLVDAKANAQAVSSGNTEAPSVVFNTQEALPYDDELDTQVLAREEIVIEKVDGSSVALQVEIARTVEQKRVGLMNRDAVPENTGMLFLFDKEEERRFWMRNTHVPLDLLFVKEDGLIFNIHERAVPFSLERIPSRGEALAVLEIAGGEAERLEISVGDKVVSRYFVQPSFNE